MNYPELINPRPPRSGYPLGDIRSLAQAFVDAVEQELIQELEFKG